MAKCKVCGKDFRKPSHLEKHNLTIEEHEALKVEACKICGAQVALEIHLSDIHSMTLQEYHSLVQCKVCLQWLKQVNAQHLATHSMTLDEYERFDPSPIFPPDPVVSFYRLAEEPETPSPEPPMVEMRLVDCSSNPFSTFVEARPGCVYYFTKPYKKNKGWLSLPAPDAYILLGGEDIPPKYPQLKFERKGR